jgi:cytochrome c-type biogenesis protein CcmH/NrfG
MAPPWGLRIYGLVATVSALTLVLMAWLALARARAEEQALADLGDDREQVVEVVRDPAGELAHRLHLLRLAQLALGRNLRIYGLVATVSALTLVLMAWLALARARAEEQAAPARASR